MSELAQRRPGGAILVEQLVVHGVRTAFGVPGESYLPVLDALIGSGIRFVVCRHEGGAANMAEASGKLTGRPGVCLVTRGPGAMHAAGGLHTAFQDGTPMLLLIGQVARCDSEREAFQEIDYRRTFGRLAKWVAEVDFAERIPELVARAFATATSGRPGPVVLSLPEDVLAETCAVRDGRPFTPSQAGPIAGDLERMRQLLEGSANPLVLVGGQPWTAQAHADLEGWCAASGLPIATAWRCQDYVDNRSPVYAGHLGLAPDPRLAQRLRECDALLVVGARLGDIETGGYEAIPIPDPERVLIHVHPSPEELGRVYEPTLPIVSSGPRFAEALAGLAPLRIGCRAALVAAARAEFEESRVTRPTEVALDPAAVILCLRELLPDGAILTNGAGNFTAWAHRFFEFRCYPTQLAPTSGSMGYGLPAAVAAKLLYPDRDVVCLAGDGDFLMTGQELATAVQHDARIVVVVFDNKMYGTIRMHQERAYPGRVSGTDLRNPDFVELARAYGCQAERVERTADFPGALSRALAADMPALIHLIVDPEALTPRETLSEIRAGASGVRESTS